MALTRIKVSSKKMVCESNPYLSDESKGLMLVSKIVSSEERQRNRNYYSVNQLIDHKLLSVSGNIDLPNELELRSRLMSLSDRLLIPAKYTLLKNRAVIGLGGKFSAGKSEFTNSILGRPVLPTAQSPTTSVPTYIISGKADHITAYNNKGANISLDEQAVKAVSHGFQNTYGLGLAQYLSFIAVSVTGFSPNLALLDTPGYNKADTSLIENYSDSQKAYSQLRSTDYLIWLVDVQNGTLTEDDIRFIKRLDLKTKVLIVINKCDLKIDSECAAVAEQARLAANNAGIPIFDVVQYSSYYPETKQGIDRVKKYFEYATNRESNVEDIQKQIDEIVSRINAAFHEKSNELIERRNMIGKAIFKSKHVIETKSLVSMYGRTNREIDEIRTNNNAFQKAYEEIKNKIRNLY